MTSHPNRSRRTDAPARNPAPEEIRALLAERGWTQARLAAELRVTPRSVERYLAGTLRMHPGLWRLAELLPHS